jgi:hypothetical protein
MDSAALRFIGLVKEERAIARGSPVASGTAREVMLGQRW